MAGTNGRAATAGDAASALGAVDRARRLLAPTAAGATRTPAGYLDVLDRRDAPASTGRAQDLMLSRALPVVYERWWRPVWGVVATGLLGPGDRDQRRIARLLLGLTPGDAVLDVACGPGNYTRGFGALVGPGGVAVGLDASPTMLARAVRDTPAAEHPSVAYVRGDAARLPFGDASFDAVCCFLALNLFEDPLASLADMTRVLKPKGRLALMTTCRTRSAALLPVVGAFSAASGMRMFGHDELTGALAVLGMADVRQRVTGFTQFVGARKPG